jgi:hypothetical protein
VTKRKAPKRSGRSLSEAERVANGGGTVKLRLPQVALEQLGELAEEGGCSRAKVVEALIRGAWAGSRGRRLESAR